MWVGEPGRFHAVEIKGQETEVYNGQRAVQRKRQPGLRVVLAKHITMEFAQL